MKVTILTLCLSAFLFAFPTQSSAATFVVNLTTDEHDVNPGDNFCDIDSINPGEQCSLRAAVEEANALVTNDRVVLPASTVTLTVANGGEIVITNNGTLAITGPGANTSTIDAFLTSRIFFTTAATVLISGVTLTGGNGTGALSTGFGGAIFAAGGSLTLDGVHVFDNIAPSNRSGGGVFFADGTHSISNSTFSQNSAGNCAGFTNNPGVTLTVVNSTISGNTASAVFSQGGAFCNDGTATLRNVTITGNTARDSGGIAQNSGALNFGNTIVAGNTATGFFPEIGFIGGTITSAGGNLVGDQTGDSSNTGNAITYHMTDILDMDPMLGPLQNNGGTTPTHALISGSPAIDGGLNALTSEPFDQRGVGFPRIRDGNGDSTVIVDIGAFERQPGSTAAGVSVGGRVTTANGRGINKVRLTITASNGELRTALSSPFGYYIFEDVQAGQTYTISASSKRYMFIDPVRVVNLNDSLTDVDFIAEP